MPTTLADRFRGLPLAILELDRSFQVRVCDAAFCALFGCEAAAVVGRTIDELCSPRDRRGALELATWMNRGAASVIDLLITLRPGARDQLARIRIVSRDD